MQDIMQEYDSHIPGLQNWKICTRTMARSDQNQGYEGKKDVKFLRLS